MLYRVHRDLRACEGERKVRRETRTLDRYLHRATGGATERAKCLVRRQASRGLAIHLDDAVAGLDASAFGGCARQRGDDRDATVSYIHPDPDTDVATARALLELTESLWIEIHRMRIAQLLHHAGDGATIEQRVGE